MTMKLLCFIELHYDMKQYLLFLRKGALLLEICICGILVKHFSSSDTESTLYDYTCKQHFVNVTIGARTSLTLLSVDV